MPDDALKYEGTVIYAAGTELSLQCHDDNHPGCPENGTGPDQPGPLQYAHHCECACHQAPRRLSRKRLSRMLAEIAQILDGRPWDHTATETIVRILRNGGYRARTQDERVEAARAAAATASELLMPFSGAHRALDAALVELARFERATTRAADVEPEDVPF